MDTGKWYRGFAEREARGSSPTYERLSLAVSLDHEVLTLLDTLPRRQRQPNTLFAVVRLLGGPVEEPAAFREFVIGQWPAVASELRTRATQTNEQQLVTLADQVQEWAIEARAARGWEAAWPSCPHHPHAHPLQARMVDGVACWVCPTMGQVIGRVGELPPHRPPAFG